MITFENCFTELTPIQKIKYLWFKREDLFAPLGENGINGSKLRQLVWLLQNAKNIGCKGVLEGAVSASPQHPMCAAVCKYLGLICNSIVGVKSIEKFPMLLLAKKYGAIFHFTNIGYAKALQAKAFALQKMDIYKNYFVLETNITLSEKLNPVERIREFHKIGAFQVQNLPNDIDNLILPCGSCNSAVSVLYGIYLYQKKVKNIILMGIGSYGSQNIQYVIDRLRLIEPNAPKIFSEINKSENNKILLIYYNLNGSGFCKYSDKMSFNYGGIEMHPTYEGKIMNYVEKKGLWDYLINDHSLFWIVGSEPRF